MVWYHKPAHGTYDEYRKLFDWDVPDEYNIAWDLLRKHEDPSGSVALFQAYPDGRRETYTYRDLDIQSNRVAHGLRRLGIESGDRVALVAPQKPEYLLTHLACWKLGAISVPISVLYGKDGLEYRFDDSGATTVVADTSVAETVADAASSCPDLEHIVEVGGSEHGTHTFESICDGTPREFHLAETDAETPAVIMYTSGTTGPPKGVLHTHDVWIGHYPGFYFAYNLDVDRSVFWTPSEWSWFGALVGTVCPALHYGRPIVGYPMGRFDPETSFELMEEFAVTDAFLAPTAVRMLMQVDDPAEQYDLALEVVMSGGEPVTSEIHEWADTQVEGVDINEGYGRTEGTTLVGNCQALFEAKPGSMGRPVPGHDVAIVDSETGENVPVGEVGEIAVRRGDDPALFSEYWNKPEKTEAERVGEWDLTGDLAERDEEGYYWYKSRADDVIITSGYRVGPGEVEEAILEHPSVEQTGVIGVPHDTRGEVIKAFVQPVGGCEPSQELREEIQEMVRDNLAKYQYPRELEFVESLPQTTTGKIQRNELRERESAEDT